MDAHQPGFTHSPGQSPALAGLVPEPGSPWENGYVEFFNGKFRDELLDAERFTTLNEAQVLIAL